MGKEFDIEKAKKFLSEREEQEKKSLEITRLATLEKTLSTLKELFQNTPIEVYLIGSVVVPFRFSHRSDVDIVLKNFDGDLFELWSILEGKIGRTVELIRFETSHFQDFILKNGLKVV